MNWRQERRADEDDLARRLDFDSAQDLYQQIRDDGHPICPKCGTTYVDEDHCEFVRKTRERKAKSFGKAVPLPSAEEAVPYFKGRLEGLIKDLEKLRGLKEYLQSERFVGVSEKNGKKKAWGARQSPPEPLATLIAIEALVAGDANSPALTHLIGKLHPSKPIEVREETARGTFTTWKPDPKMVPMEDLDNQIRKLREHADNVAKLVRGREKIRKGPTTGEISPRDHSVIDLVKQRVQEGYSNEQILEEVNRRFDRGSLAALGIEDDLTLEDIRHLQTLPLDGSIS